VNVHYKHFDECLHDTNHDSETSQEVKSTFTVITFQLSISTDI